MKRYFFDIMAHERPELDYTGRVFATPEAAYEAAEVIAFDLVVKWEDELVGSAVTVSNAEGRKLFSIPVQASYLAATSLAQ